MTIAKSMNTAVHIGNDMSVSGYNNYFMAAAIYDQYCMAPHLPP